MHNRIELIGRLGAAPEIRSTGNNNRVANISVATWRPRYSSGEIVRDEKTGHAEQETEWHRVVAFNGLAKSAENCVKGMLVQVIGRNRTSKSTDRNGSDHFSTEIIAETCPGSAPMAQN